MHPQPTNAPTQCYAVIGGDSRSVHLAAALSEAGHTVCLFGAGRDCPPVTEEGNGRVTVCATLHKAVEEATVVILPLPVTRDGVTVACPRDPACRIPLCDVAELMTRRPDLTLMGGRLPAILIPPARGEMEERVLDYYADETLQRRNAYLTAEAALMTAMSLSDGALGGTAAAVVGYGRIGQALARLLRGIGVEVTVCARRHETLEAAAAEGCATRLLGGAGETLFRRGEAPPLLFNTVPAPVLGASTLGELKRGTVLIDLASAPFGVEPESLRKATEGGGLRYLRAPSLPGSYAPRDGGYAMAECILRLTAALPPQGERGGQGR